MSRVRDRLCVVKVTIREHNRDTTPYPARAHPPGSSGSIGGCRELSVFCKNRYLGLIACRSAANEYHQGWSNWQRGNTIVLVTHEHHIAEYAHRAIHLKDGLIAGDAPRPSHGPHRTRSPI